MSENFLQIGARIRELREICGYTEEELAKDLGISLKTYQSYETLGENIPISALHHLSVKFRVDMTHLLTGQTPRLDSYCLVKKGAGRRIERYTGYSFQSLAYGFMNRIMEPLMVTVAPSDTDPELVVHQGQEFNMVISGRIMVIFDDKRLILEEGDSIYFNPMHPHGQKALDGQEAVFITVIAE